MTLEKIKNHRGFCCIQISSFCFYSLLTGSLIAQKQSIQVSRKFISRDVFGYYHTIVIYQIVTKSAL